MIYKEGCLNIIVENVRKCEIILAAVSSVMTALTVRKYYK